jgi:glycosyltransferase involved in cell wall biosynthesis
MPVSFESGKAYIREFINKISHSKMIDIGVGCGTYAKMFPESHWTGVEIFGPYVEKFGLKKIYQKLIIEDARKIDYLSLGSFDVAIAGDILEHMSANEAKELLENLKNISDTVIVSIPLGHHPQGEVDGNIYESHVEDWSDNKVISIFGIPSESHIDGCIGVYIYSKTKKLKICVYTISKNEEKFVKRWAESSSDADVLLIADTGSTDRTVEIAKECGIQVHSICITPWRFDHARNASIALIPKDIDVCICMDMDEVLEPGWREEIERVWVSNTTRLSYFFDWGCGIKFRYEKIHARHGYFWHHPCHEYPVPDKRITEVYAYTDKLLVSHHPDPNKSRGQYMDLLQLSVDEDPLCPRNAFYYARELSFNRRWQESIDACKKYLELPGATWANERCYAMRVMAKCYEELGNSLEAEAWLQRASAEAPNTREPWCQLAMLMYRQSRWPECYAAAKRALSITQRDLVYTCDPEVWGHWANDLASISAWQLGMKEEALEQAELAVQATPTDQRLINNLSFIKNTMANNHIPNIIHFIFFFGPKSRPFGIINYLSVIAAYEIQKPDKIYFYYNEEPVGNKYWDGMKKYVEMVRVDPPTEYEGVSLDDWPQYQSDVLRLQKLYEHGGIYLDTDCILMKPLDCFLNNDVVMSGHIAGVSKSPWHKVDSMPASTIIARPRAKFIKIWLSKLADGLRKNVWAWHIVNLPVEIYKDRPDLITLLEMEVFMPFDFKNEKMLEPDQTEEALREIKDSYAIHMWDSVWFNPIKKIDENYIQNVDTGFTLTVRKYLE